MSFGKLSDDFADDCWTLSDAAFRLHVEGLCWNGRKLLDCRIPKDDLRRFARHPEAVAELVEVGWWVDAGEAYLIRHHAAYQRSREQVLHQQQVNRENALKGGRPPKPSREQASEIQPAGTDSVSEPLPETDSVSDAQSEREGLGWVGEVTKPSHDENGTHAPACARESGDGDRPGCDRCGAAPSRIDTTGARRCRACAPRLWGERPTDQSEGRATA